MNLQLTEENETFIKEAVRNGRFGSDDAVINEALRLLRDTEEDQATDAPLAQDEWEAEFSAWARGHRTLDRPADDSRETIYSGRGE